MVSTSEDVKKKGRAIGISFSKSDEFLFQCVKYISDHEDRSMSKVIVRILRTYFDESDKEFKDNVLHEMDMSDEQVSR
jgi:hypothetical protein